MTIACLNATAGDGDATCDVRTAQDSGRCYQREDCCGAAGVTGVPDNATRLLMLVIVLTRASQSCGVITVLGQLLAVVPSVDANKQDGR